MKDTIITFIVLGLIIVGAVIVTFVWQVTLGMDDDMNPIQFETEEEAG